MSEQTEVNKKKVYISGAISGLPIEDVKKSFNRAEKTLEESGFIPVNPIKVQPFVKDFTWLDYMKAGIKALVDCDAIYLLDNWESSKGAKIEVDLALSLGIYVINKDLNQ